MMKTRVSLATGLLLTAACFISAPSASAQGWLSRATGGAIRTPESIRKIAPNGIQFPRRTETPYTLPMEDVPYRSQKQAQAPTYQSNNNNNWQAQQQEQQRLAIQQQQLRQQLQQQQQYNLQQQQFQNQQVWQQQQNRLREEQMIINGVGGIIQSLFQAPNQNRGYPQGGYQRNYGYQQQGYNNQQPMYQGW